MDQANSVGGIGKKINNTPALLRTTGQGELEKGGREVRVRAEGQLAFNNVSMIVPASEAGVGQGFVMEYQVAKQLAGRWLVRVLGDWCPPFPSRGQPSAAFAVVLSALRFRVGRPAG